MSGMLAAALKRYAYRLDRNSAARAVANHAKPHHTTQSKAAQVHGQASR